MQGFHFSTINHAMTSENPYDSINLFWNQQMAQNQANASLFITPNFQASIGFEYPEFGMFGNNLLNPMLAIQQTMQSFQNGSWANGMNNFGFGNFGNFGNFGFGTPWGNFQSPWGTPDGLGGANKSAKEKEYDKLKKVLNEYKKIADDTTIDKINEAMKKSGKVEEKLEALKDVAKTLNHSKIKEALLALDPYKASLIKIGNTSSDADRDVQIRQNIEPAFKEITEKGKFDKLSAYILSGNSDDDILKVLSYWNDKHNEDSDRSIIRAVAKKIPTGKDADANHKAVVAKVANSLVSYSEKLKRSLKDTDLTNLDKSVEEVTDALEKAEKNFNKANVLALAEKAEDLYARLRLLEAEKIRNDLQKEYKFLNDVTGKTIVDEKTIVGDTEADLKKEGVKIPTNRDNAPSYKEENKVNSDLDSKPVDEQISGLKTDKQVITERKTKVGTFYQTHTTQGLHPHYYMKDGDELVELKDVVSIDNDGNCKLKNGKTKKLSEVEKETVKPSDIETYAKTIKDVIDLKKQGKLEECKTTPKSWKDQGLTLFWSKGRKADGAHQCFVVLGNELMQIDCKYVDKAGNIVMEDGSKISVNELNESYCTSADYSSILAKDEPKEQKKATQTKTTESKVEVDESATPEENGKVVRQRLRGDTSANDYDTVQEIIKKLDSYSAEEVANFIEGYNTERGDQVIPWNGRLCAQISSENDFGYMRKDACLRTIARGVLRMMDELGISKNSYDYTEMLAYSKVGLDKNGKPKKNFSNSDSCKEWRAVAGGWKSWSFWSSERTGAANHMDDIIKRVLKQYREKNTTTEETTSAE